MRGNAPNFTRLQEEATPEEVATVVAFQQYSAGRTLQGNAPNFTRLQEEATPEEVAAVVAFQLSGKIG